MSYTQTDQTQVNQAKVLKDYEKQGDEIIRQMLNVLMRAQKKVDNVAYRKLLEQIQKEAN
ncbi:MAG: hypothetical protein N3A54_06675 [Patescibacteria group bacterium]|nr:hypothetical protein [Patescibacteria group bacterium]